VVDAVVAYGLQQHRMNFPHLYQYQSFTPALETELPLVTLRNVIELAEHD